MLVHCIRKAEDSIKLLCRPDSPIILIFDPRAGTQFQGEPLEQGCKIKEGEKIWQFFTEITVYL